MVKVRLLTKEKNGKKKKLKIEKLYLARSSSSQSKALREAMKLNAYAKINEALYCERKDLRIFTFNCEMVKVQ